MGLEEYRVKSEKNRKNRKRLNERLFISGLPEALLYLYTVDLTPYFMYFMWSGVLDSQLAIMSLYHIL